MIRSFKTFNGKQELKVSFSDQQLKIRQIETGNVYDTATDVLDAPYTYEETDLPIETLQDEETGLPE